MARRNKHSRSELKEMILDVAEEAVQKKGFSGLKVRQIAADIGYTVASIYMIFANMHDLSMQLKARIYCKLNASLRLKLSGKSVNLEFLAMEYIYFAFENKGLWNMLFGQPLPLNEPVPIEYNQAQIELNAIFEAVICESLGIESGVQSQELAQVYSASLYGIVTQAFINQRSYEQTKAALQIGLNLAKY